MLCVLPWCEKEFAQEMRLLLWMGELGGCHNHDALMVLGAKVSDEQRVEMYALAKRVFANVDVIRAFYEDPRPWPVNANLMFQRTARHVNDHVHKPWFWCEPDCIPLVPGWLDKWDAEYQACGKPYMGCVVKDPHHLTGCAVYPPDISKFSPHPLLCEEVAFDVVDVRKILPHAHHTDLYHHQWYYNVPPQSPNTYSSAATVFNTQEDLKIIGDRAVLFHRNKDGTLIDRLRERMHGNMRVAAPAIVQSEPPAEAEVDAAEPASSEPTAKYKMSILIRTWSQDAPWLPFCLRSIHKYARGFNRVLVVAQEKDEPIIRPICAAHQVEYRSVENDPCDGYIAQQITKLKADEYLPEADYILHLDSDTLFTMESFPKHFISPHFGNRCVILMQDYGTFGKENMPWQKPTELALGDSVQYEFMRRHPLVYPRWLYKEARDHLTKRFNIPWDRWVADQVGPTKGFSEFNYLGAFAFKYHHDKFRWVDVKKKTISPDRVHQFWSWGGLKEEQKRKIDDILK